MYDKSKLKNTILVLLILTILVFFSCSDKDVATTGDKVSALIEQLGDSDFQVSSRASWDLYELSKESGEVIQALVKALEDDGMNGRAWAAHTLGMIGLEREVPEKPLLDALEDEELLVRIEAAGALSGIRGDAQDVIEILFDGLKDNDWNIRVRTAFVFLALSPEIKQKVPEAIPALVDLLGDPEVQVRYAASVPLAEFGAPAVPYLIEALDDGDPAKRDLAIDTLAYIGTDARDAIPSFITALVDKEERIRFDAAWALVKIGSESTELVLPLLIKGLRIDPKSSVPYRSAEALGEIGPAAADSIPTILEVFETSSGLLKMDLALAMAKISQDHVDLGVTTLIEFLKNGEKSDRITAIMRLSEIGPYAEEALPILKDLVDEVENQFTKEILLNAIAEIKGEPLDAAIAPGN